MTRTTGNSSESRKILEGECCDLYGEYCYPCNTTAIADAAPKEGVKKSAKSKKRNAH